MYEDIRSTVQDFAACHTTNTVSQGLIDGEKDALGYAIWGMPSLPCWFSCSMLNAQCSIEFSAGELAIHDGAYSMALTRIGQEQLMSLS